MKEKIFIIFGIVLFITLFIGTFTYMENKEDIYYTQIDNAKIKKLDFKDDMKYEYNLEIYDKYGRKKELSFKTNRELRESAYLKLEVRTFGVHSWMEVEYDELPEKVKDKYKNKE